MMLSSAGQAGDAARCRELGVATYLTKPIRQSYLLDAIMVALGTRAGAAGDGPARCRDETGRSDGERARKADPARGR